MLLGKTGTLTLEALSWLRAIGAALVHFGPDGALLTQSVPYGYDGLRLRRAQGLAVTTGLDVRLARMLIELKLQGQRANLVRLGATDLRSFDASCEALDRTTTIDEVRLVEAKIASLYWNAWREVPLRFRARDLARIPARWARYDSRTSVLTAAPRAATNPVNALLNYLYSLLEAESRLALLAVGLDPTLGVLHADHRNRDSFALDVMEPVRADVDAFVLDLLAKRVFTSRDFVELPNGVCRVRAPLTHDLALTLPQWRLGVAPIVAHLAQAFQDTLFERRTDIVETRARSRGNRPHSIIASQSPLFATPRKALAARPYASKAWNNPRADAQPLIKVFCASCGDLVQKRRRRYCEACLPREGRKRAERAVAIARKALAAQTRRGFDPRATPVANARRAEANAEHHRQNRAAGGRTTASEREVFLREITPKLDSLSLSVISVATGLTMAYCSKVRCAKAVPHRRHWGAFSELVKTGP